MHNKNAHAKIKPATENFLEICLIKIIFTYNISDVQLQGKLSVFCMLFLWSFVNVIYFYKFKSLEKKI